eukprot:gene4894-biopygen6203
MGRGGEEARDPWGYSGITEVTEVTDATVDTVRRPGREALEELQRVQGGGSPVREAVVLEVVRVRLAARAEHADAHALEALADEGLERRRQYVHRRGRNAAGGGIGSTGSRVARRACRGGATGRSGGNTGRSEMFSLFFRRTREKRFHSK